MADEAMGKGAVLSWTDERVELLRKLWLDGLSASRIAAELSGGVTRNAVIGKVHRLGLSGRIKAPNAAPGIRPRPLEKAATQVETPRIGTLPPRPAPLPIRGNVAMAIQDRPVPAPQARRSFDDNVLCLAENVTIMELRESMCRWPVGDPSSAEFRYCGGKATIGEGPYCKFHSRMAYQPTQDRRQRKIA